MRVKALVGFSGKLSMYLGEEREIEDKEVLTDLLSCGYVEELEVKKSSKRVKKDESK